MQGAKLLRVATNGPTEERKMRKTRIRSVELGTAKQTSIDTERRKSVPSVSSTEAVDQQEQSLANTAPQLGAALRKDRNASSMSL